MDIIITELTEEFLRKNIKSFIDIIAGDPYEYWGKEHFLKALPSKYKLSVCACSGEKIVGYIISSQKYDVAYIHKFFVSEGFRNKHIGQQLHNLFEKKSVHLGLRSMCLTVLAINENAIRFYERNGYSRESKRIDKINNIQLIVMKKLLR